MRPSERVRQAKNAPLGSVVFIAFGAFLAVRIFLAGAGMPEWRVQIASVPSAGRAFETSSPGALLVSRVPARSE